MLSYVHEREDHMIYSNFMQLIVLPMLWLAISRHYDLKLRGWLAILTVSYVLVELGALN